MSDPATLPLRDIHLPEPVSWWPPAYGWWLLALALLALGLWALARRARRPARSSRAIALDALDAVEARYRAQGDARAAAAAISTLLRRLALSLAPREEVAGLTGERWLGWLQAHAGGGAPLSAPAALLEMPYQRDPHPDVGALLAECRALVRALDAPAGTP